MVNRSFKSGFAGVNDLVTVIPSAAGPWVRVCLSQAGSGLCLPCIYHMLTKPLVLFWDICFQSHSFPLAAFLLAVSAASYQQPAREWVAPLVKWQANERQDRWDDI